MAISVVRLGSARAPGEGVRMGTVRLPPRGVPKTRHAPDDWYDVWLPMLAPSVGLMNSFRASVTPTRWSTFARRYRAEMRRPDAAHLLAALAALSHKTNFSVGCYCEDETQCHRSLLQQLLEKHGATMR